MNGKKPTGYEIQLLRDSLGRDFNPTSTIRKRILNPPIDHEGITTEVLVTETLKQIHRLEARLGDFEVELLQRLFRLETFQLNLLQKVDQILKQVSPATEKQAE
ncbi:MAG: hypothetical protein KF760_07530 [Candidatus Eremiobacteraeota bacterium]|nr:hypothetical protein [Candidatus Eremiobacteraeota bacterium]MCW5869745.1 hypothetical protein [Candidatus Eremiobacteraeota bacterium]